MIADCPTDEFLQTGWSDPHILAHDARASCWARNAPVPHLPVAGHVIFTSDGQSVISDETRRLRRIRRSFCKSWRNDKWRDLLLAFGHWLSSGASAIEIPLGEAAALRLRLPPITWDAAFGIETASDHEFVSVEEEDEEEPNDKEGIFEDDDDAPDVDEDEIDTADDP